jgi:hypothetical protein
VGGGCAAELYSGKGDPGSLKNLTTLVETGLHLRIVQEVVPRVSIEPDILFSTLSARSISVGTAP